MRWFARVGIRSFRGVGLNDAVFGTVWCTIYWGLALRDNVGNGYGRKVRIIPNHGALGRLVCFECTL